MSISGKNSDLSKLSARMQVHYIKQVQQETQRTYNEMKNTIYSYINKFGEEGKLTRTEMYKYARYQKLQAQLMKDLTAFDMLNQRQIAAYLADQYQLSYFHTGYILESEYQIKLAYGNLNREQISKGILTPLNKISLENNRALIKQKIRSSIVQGISQGEGIRELSQRIKKDLEDNANNAVRIARTETTRVMNAAKQDSYEHAEARGLPIKKQWVSTLDSKTRDRHQDLDGEAVKLDERFSNGLMYPGDQAGPPEETINCRCTMITVLDGYDSPYEFRRARGVEGGNEIIPYKTFKEWEKERIAA